MATRLQSGDKTLNLRSNSGAPRWGTRPSQPQREEMGTQSENRQQNQDQNRSGQSNR